WNIFTYKWHAMGDYVNTISIYGTLDSLSTQIGELAHRLCKMLYTKTNRRGFETQIATQERRRRILRDVKGSQLHTKIANDTEVLQPTPPREHHHISESRSSSIDTADILDDVREEPALADFFPKLRLHLLERLVGRKWDGNYTQEDLRNVVIVGDRLFAHKYMRVNYTTYDCRRDEDMVHAATRPDIMMLSRDDNPAHPYTYARVVTIYHAQVRHFGDRSENPRTIHEMQFLWVRFFERDATRPGGWKHKRLHRLKFKGSRDDPASGFGFVNPRRVIRGAHLIPAFFYGKTDKYLGPSTFHQIQSDEETDYLYQYVNNFVDRDMFMRYAGDAVGHLTAELCPDFLDVNIDDATRAEDSASEDDS
ncbi:hypothetical protein GGX14DRAFT_626860, partial [Mycena pura]